jgi:hypothetical protein
VFLIGGHDGPARLGARADQLVRLRDDLSARAGARHACGADLPGFATLRGHPCPEVARGSICYIVPSG